MKLKLLLYKSEKDSEEDIKKAFKLFIDDTTDGEKEKITFASLKRVVEDLGLSQ